MLKLVILSVLGALVVASPADRLKRADAANPCTPEALLGNKTYFSVDGDKSSFIECDRLGHPNVINCPSGLVWDENRLTCVYAFELLAANNGTATGTGSGNGGSGSGTDESWKDQCSQENIKAGKLFFPHPDTNKFVQCDLWGDVYVGSCPSGLVWNAKVEACDSAFLQASIG